MGGTVAGVEGVVAVPPSEAIMRTMKKAIGAITAQGRHDDELAGAARPSGLR